MTAATLESKSTGSVWFVVGLTIVALILGWGVKTSTEGRGRSFSASGVTAMLPAQWLVETAGAGPLNGDSLEPGEVFNAWNPMDPATRYSTSLLPSGADVGLATAAALRNLQRAQSLTAYRVIEQTPVELSGRSGYRVTFAFVDATALDAVPVVFQGIDYYFPADGQVIVVTLETSHDFETAAVSFREFAAGVELGE